MQIIPAIDIINGKCVRLTQGDYRQQKVYAEDPLEVAKQFEAVGLKRLHLVDLDGAKAKQIVNQEVLNKIHNNTNLKIDFGGGIKTDEDIKIAFETGATQVTVGTIAVKSPKIFLGWLKQYGPEKLILGADVKDGFIATHGWKEVSEMKILTFLDYYLKEGIEYVLCTDISKDGMLKGSSVGLYEKIIHAFPTIKLIASGGVSTLEELKILESIGCHGAIIGKAIYEGKLLLEDLKLFQDAN